MIVFRNIVKKFDTNVVLDGVSGCFFSGKVNLLVGASGTGKSVLVKCLVGLERIQAGEVMFEDQPLEQMKEGKKMELRRNIGMLFQGGALFDSKTIEENVRFPLDILTNLSPAEKKERVMFCLERVGLTQLNTKRTSEISGGQKKRVGIARAIVTQPKYLFCDEPNSGLDPKTSLLIDKLIEEITHDFNITTVVVTHDISSMVGIGEHIIFLHQGKVSWEGTSQDIFEAKDPAFKEFFYSSKLTKLAQKAHQIDERHN